MNYAERRPLVQVLREGISAGETSTVLLFKLAHCYGIAIVCPAVMISSKIHDWSRREARLTLLIKFLVLHVAEDLGRRKK